MGETLNLFRFKVYQYLSLINLTEFYVLLEVTYLEVILLIILMILV